MRKMITIMEVEKIGRKLIVTVGADDPNELLETETADKALKAAHRKGYKECLHIGKIHVRGQSSLAFRRFTFIR